MNLGDIFEALLYEAVRDIADGPALAAAAAGLQERAAALCRSGPIRRYLACGYHSLLQTPFLHYSPVSDTPLRLLCPRSNIPHLVRSSCRALGRVERRRKLERSLFADAGEMALVMSPMAMLLLGYQHRG